MGRHLPPWVRRSKFKAIKATDPSTGEVFDSKGELKRWLQLKEQWQAGVISNLRRQVELPLIVNGVQIAVYKADFAYSDEDDERVVEDFKGFETPEFKLKRKLVWAIHRIRIVCTRERLDIGKTLKRMKQELDDLED
jgi:Protein of unknown function (DUF1064)